ncbi:Ribokinase-like protein [Naematelia encephala]|uniref:Ribokinase-like protein n=1 Tax=Naematelia encephala TaxID=71784 RepID=A0A1Y2AK91_9TREE|nr:Ribokinase-like protein [Naematelia encephala]
MSTRDGLGPPSEEFLRSKGRLATLGMFVIDHFSVTDSEGIPIPSDEEAIGGGGIFAMTAARLFLPPSSCSLLVDKGADFPPQFERQLREFGYDMVWFRPRSGPTTRAVNIYSGTRIGEGHQSFQYLSPQLHLFLRNLILPPSPFATQHLPEWIHVVCNCERARAIVDEMIYIRNGHLEEGLGKGWKGQMIWEPLGKACRAEELEEILHLAPSFAVFSPNLLELQTILSIKPTEPATLKDAEFAAHAFRDKLAGSGRDVPAIVVRAGELGSYTLSTTWTGWVPAFWGEDGQDKVVDVTGGGNGYLGGFMAGLLISDGNMRTASIYGSTAASFAIEQRGLPRLSNTPHGERWNDDDPWQRLYTMARRVDEAERNATT